MRKTILSNLAIFAILAIAVSLAWAGGNDAWKTKSYQQWDAKDVEQVLGNSPWVKAATVAASWHSSGAYGKAPNAGATPPSGGSGQMDTPQGGGGGGMQGGGYSQGGAMAGQRKGGSGGGDEDEGGGGEADAQGPRMVSFTVRWESSQTIREAIAQNAVLSKKLTQAEAEKFVAQASATYDVFVTSTDMTPFANLSESDLQDRTFLEAKQSKQKITPSSIKIQRSEDKKNVVFVLFSFPRQTAGNQPLISPKDKDVAFQCKIKSLDLHTNFDLHKMTNDKGQDL